MYCFYREWIKPTKRELVKVKARLKEFEDKYGDVKKDRLSDYNDDEY